MSDDGSDRRQTQLDVSILKQMALDMDESIILSVLTMFLADGQELIAQLELVLASADDDALAKTAHKLGGNTAACGQTGLSRILYDCENSIRVGDIHEGREHAKEFLALAPAGFESLSNYLESLKRQSVQNASLKEKDRR